MQGKLIVIEGLDGSGKQTQTGLLCSRLREEGLPVQQVTFPNYDTPAGELIKMYLNGEFGDNANSVNPYAASIFYAADRFASHNQHWRIPYQDGTLILADRYTTSNMIHQTAKIPPDQRDSFLDWLCDLEYNRLGLPKPDKVIFLDMPTASARVLTQSRDQKFAGVDIHEKDEVYLEACRETALYCVQKYNWTTIACTQNNAIRTIKEISQEIYETVKLS